MFGRSLALAFKHVLGGRLYAAVNLLGLALGLSCCLLILQFVRFELSWDGQWEQAENIYRVSREYFPVDGARLRVPASANAPVGPALAQDFPQVERSARVFGGNLTLRRGDEIHREEGLRLADPELLRIFDFHWLAGDPASALASPDSLVLTRALAEKYFGRSDVLGERLRVADTAELRVTGVIDDLPPNSHLSLSGLLPLELLRRMGLNLDQWNGNTDFHTYVQLRAGADPAVLEAAFPAFLERYAGEGASTASALRLMNVRDIHLRSNRDEEWRRPGSLGAVYGFGAIALGILLIACINFTCIATARSTQRAREIGMRKAMGASRGLLVRQFLGETALLVVLTLLLAFPLGELLLPPFEALMGMALLLDPAADPGLLLLTGGLALLALGAAGAYPALYLAGFQPALVLRGRLSQDSGARLRAGLVILQFAIAIALIASAFVVRQQLRFSAELDLGFDPEDVLVLESSAVRGFGQEWPAFKQRLLESPAVEKVTTSHYLPFAFNDNQIELQVPGNAPSRVQYVLVDYDFFETYRIRVREGRSFQPGFAQDRVAPSEDGSNAQASFVLNAAAARALGLPAQAALGSRVEMPAVSTSGNLVGVVDDTAFESSRSRIRPLVFLLAPPDLELGLQAFRQAALRVLPGGEAAALAHARSVWREFYPNQPFDWRLLTQDLRAQYGAEARQLSLLSGFAVLAVLLSCFGLFGLAAFATERRRKEIGVRKVLGSGVWRPLRLLSSDFLKLVLWANLLAWPVAYLLLSRWLANFAYRVDLTPLVFIGAGLFTLAVAWLTVGGTAARAATRPPALALRHE